jgi:hypothetical protein
VDPQQAAPQPSIINLPGAEAGNTLPTHWPSLDEVLQWCHAMHPGTAAILVLVGVLYLLFGYYMFKGLVILNAAALGAALGALLGSHQGAALPAALVGAVVAAAVTWPLMRYAVAIMGGMFGAMVGASLWNTFNPHPEFAWAGAVMGLIACSLLCFIVFRGCVMSFTALQGAAMAVFGILGLALKYDGVAPSVLNTFQTSHLTMPIAIFLPTLAGIIFQQFNTAEDGGAEDAGSKK